MISGLGPMNFLANRRSFSTKIDTTKLMKDLVIKIKDDICDGNFDQAFQQLDALESFIKNQAIGDIYISETLLLLTNLRAAALLHKGRTNVKNGNEIQARQDLDLAKKFYELFIVESD